MSEEPRRGDGTPIADGISVAPPGLGGEGGAMLRKSRGWRPWLLTTAPPGLKTYAHLLIFRGSGVGPRHEDCPPGDPQIVPARPASVNGGARRRKPPAPRFPSPAEGLISGVWEPASDTSTAC